jgi:hypothetical protein
LKFDYDFNKNLYIDNLPKKLLELTINSSNESFDIIPIIAKFNVSYYYYGINNYFINNKSYYISMNDKNDMDNYIDNYTKDKYIGQIISEELFSKVFNPTRIVNMAKKYNFDEIKFFDYY